MIKKIPCISILCISFFIYACSDNEVTKEDQVRQYIAAGIKAAEDRNHSDFSDLIHKNYLDHKSLNKTKLINLVRGYFFQHKNIHLFTKIDKIVFQDENNASVVMFIAMSGNVISDVNVLLSLRARIYKFELQLTKDDAWLLRQANWQIANIKDVM